MRAPPTSRRSRLAPLALLCLTSAVLAAAASTAAGCSSSATGDPSAPEATGVTPPPPPPAGDPAGEPSPSPAGAAPRTTAPRTAADCTQLVTDITNDPPLDGGVAMNNATTAGDAGGSDRLVPLMEAVQKDRDAFRCCFDLWGKDHQGEQAKIALVIEIDPSGKLSRAAFKQAETDLKDPAVEACMAEVAKKIAFPPSPSGKETTYTHRFEFKSRVFAR